MTSGGGGGGLGGGLGGGGDGGGNGGGGLGGGGRGGGEGRKQSRPLVLLDVILTSLHGNPASGPRRHVPEMSVHRTLQNVRPLFSRTRMTSTMPPSLFSQIAVVAHRTRTKRMIRRTRYTAREETPRAHTLYSCVPGSVCNVQALDEVEENHVHCLKPFTYLNLFLNFLALTLSSLHLPSPEQKPKAEASNAKLSASTATARRTESLPIFTTMRSHGWHTPRTPCPPTATTTTPAFPRRVSPPPPHSSKLINRFQQLRSRRSLN